MVVRLAERALFSPATWGELASGPMPGPVVSAMAGGGRDDPAERLAVVAVVGGVTRAEADALGVLVQDHNRSAPARTARASMRARRAARDPAGALARSPRTCGLACSPR